MDDLLSEFLTETSESLDALDTQLITLEQDPNDAETLNNIFRMVHTVKGTCGFLGLPRLESVAHAAENILGKFRDGELPVTGDSVTLILESIDTIKSLLLVLEETEAEPEGSDIDLIERLNAAAGMGDAAPAPEPAPEPVQAPAADAEIGANIVSSTNSAELDALEAAFQAAPGPDEIAAQEAEEAPAEEVEEPPVEEIVADVPAAIEAVAKGPAGGAAEGAKKESAIANQSIRVSVDLLENLMNMVSELVLTRNQLLQMVRRMDDSEFAVPLQRLSHCTTELQEGVMQTRMQPIGNAWSKLPRIIRDLSNELDKKIDLVMNGAETELDRQVLELIKDPLTHMVRNSADHGLETPEQRVAAGKPETGKVELNAYHEGGHIIIEINDDGRGLAVNKIRQKAIENGLTTEAEADGMSDHQIQQFVMRAGFSTAAKVTSVSGRGVGMDVVRSNIEKIGGTIDFKSVEGKGTHFTIKIPLTLAIVAALIVESGAERFAIPQLSVVELVRASADSEHRIETINDTPVLRLRDRLLPLIRLDQVLGLEPKAIEEVATVAAEEAEQAEQAAVEGTDPSDETSEEANDDVSFVVVTQAGPVSFGLLVDRVFDSEEIVVKPVSPILREIGVFSGNTILGDGSVIMILDPNGLSVSVGAETAAETSMDLSSDVSKKAGEEAVSILVFRAGSEEPKSVPLALVARLEEIAVEDIEQTESGHVVQYRGQLMPLVMGDPACQFKETGRQSVLVFADERHTMGLVVDEIIDIVDQVLDVELVSSRQGIVGTAVIDGKATEVLDVAHFLTDAFDDWFIGTDNSGAPSSGEPCKVLVVDDSPFFRSMLMPVLTVAGYKPMAVESPAAALKLRENGQKFNLIISDIEMPGMDGFEFAQEVKTSGAWQNTPMVALSSRSMQQDFDRGREVGFDDYVTKFDRDTLLATITQTLSVAAGE